MEISDVKRAVHETIDRAKRGAAERRTRNDEAAREFNAFLAEVAAPLFRQIANVLRARSYMFNVFTPSASVRLMSDTSSEDYIELVLDSSGDEPTVLGRSSRSRGSRLVKTERPIGAGPIREIGENEVLAFVMKELEPLVEK